MVRPYAVKGKKRKKSEGKHYREEADEQQQLEAVKRTMFHKTASNGDDEQAVDTEKDGANGDIDELDGIPLAPSDQKDVNRAGVTFILEKASLEVAKVGKTYQLLNSDDHSNFLRRNNRNPADYRPDIVHQALLMILDSVLNKAGMLRAVYVKTDKGDLIEIKPNVRIPRTFKRFAGIMLQLLQKLSINAVGKREKLMKVIRNPVTQYLPLNSRKIGLSYSSEKLVKLQDYVETYSNDTSLVFVVGAMAHGKVETDYTDDYIAISSYPLSAAVCIGKICVALENKWNLL
ncbi:uncharacterized protein LOC107435882 [Ziziphus jujuba]|uniref:ribosomal RNA Small subunit methyltransferase Nep1-like n=1 Tax=Ziziphus jujuba TaxID=326968 RepID=A0A6P4AU77_ZIZJJ|nr:uncharacterized protein LOC107435882 [Ziziphus jujuba]